MFDLGFENTLAQWMWQVLVMRFSRVTTRSLRDAREGILVGRNENGSVTKYYENGRSELIQMYQLAVPDD